MASRSRRACIPRWLKPHKEACGREKFLSLLPEVELPGVEGQVRGFFMQALTMLDALNPAYELANRSIDEGLRAGEIGSHIYLADFWLPRNASVPPGSALPGTGDEAEND
jgi:hypothetical protein